MRGRARLRRLCAGAGVLVAVGAAALGSGAPAGAAQPLVLDNCRATVEGTPGQPITLNPAAVAGPVVTAVKAIPLVGETLAGQVGPAVGAMAPIPLGVVPAGERYISGAEIAAAATVALRTLPVLATVVDTVLPSAQSALTAGCGITVHLANTAAGLVGVGAGAPPDTRQPAPGAKPTTPPPAKSGDSGNRNGVAPRQGQPATTGGSGDTSAVGGLAPGDSQLDQPATTSSWDFGRVPLDDYAWLPVALPGDFVPTPDIRYGDKVPGSAPDKGALTRQGAGDGAGSGRDAAASHSRLATATARLVSTPVLLAVFALLAVTAVLVRSWVPRKSPSGSGRHRAAT